MDCPHIVIILFKHQKITPICVVGSFRCVLLECVDSWRCCRADQYGKAGMHEAYHCFPEIDEHVRRHSLSANAVAVVQVLIFLALQNWKQFRSRRHHNHNRVWYHNRSRRHNCYWSGSGRRCYDLRLYEVRSTTHSSDHSDRWETHAEVNDY